MADSLPKERLLAWKQELSRYPEAKAKAEERRRIENWLDKGFGAAHLKDPRIAALVESAMIHFDSERYRLHAWVVMPNHVHALLTPSEGHALGQILHSWKSYTAHEALKILRSARVADAGGCAQSFWQTESFDRYIRNDRHFQACVDYIHMNPVKARLCLTPSDWPWSSAKRWVEPQG